MTRFQPQREPEGIGLERLAVVHADLSAAAPAEQPLGHIGAPDPPQLLAALELHVLAGKRGEGHVEAAGETATHAATQFMLGQKERERGIQEIMRRKIDLHWKDATQALAALGPNTIL